MDKKFKKREIEGEMGICCLVDESLRNKVENGV